MRRLLVLVVLAAAGCSENKVENTGAAPTPAPGKKAPEGYGPPGAGPLGPPPGSKAGGPPPPPGKRP